MTWTIQQRNEAQLQLRERLVSLSEELERIIEAFPDPSPDGLERLYTERDLRWADGGANSLKIALGSLRHYLGLQPKGQD